ncbi:hypothetical protein DHEL01_v212186 [Diaporthe helianthi]|uniref:BZIP domain-containing protein n=1 Tax=Diaporthe helianthi TaxID=158607 RepID=A0A2P5HGP1_DIAHE|nr:hypothetical protein DHEL01_v212186 [Diaporthe helianthi]
MPRRQVKSDPEEDNGQESPGLWAIQPIPGSYASQESNSTSVIHETEESNFSSQLPGLEGTALGNQSYLFSCPINTNIINTPSPFEDPFVSDRIFFTAAPTMNTMPRNLLPSSRHTHNQGPSGSVTGAGVTKSSSHQQGRTARGIATNQAVTQAALGMAGNPSQASNQGPFSTIDLTAMDYSIGSPSSMDLYGSTLNSGIDLNSFLSSSYNPFSSAGAGVQQNLQGQGARDMSPVPKFDPEFTSPSADFLSPSQYESFGEEERKTKPDPRPSRTGGTPTRAPRKQRASMALPNISSPATVDISSPGDSSFEATSGTRARDAPIYQAHVPPNRIAEAGPVTHPDPEWRPYGVNHWHVFLREPTMLKFLSSTEIKDIREHCYEMAAKGAGEGDGDGDDEPQPVAPGSQYTTIDAQAVWKHCDAYIRRRSQVRNNQAARRSRQRKDAETRYWKTLAIHYGAPDHEFDWNLVDDEGNIPDDVAVDSASAARVAAGAGGGGGGALQTRARTRGRARAQQQQQQATANRRSSAHSSTAARPDFDFNQPLDYGEDDDKTGAGKFDPFTGAL